jgi:hypothetical protein
MEISSKTRRDVGVQIKIALANWRQTSCLIVYKVRRKSSEEKQKQQ